MASSILANASQERIDEIKRNLSRGVDYYGLIDMLDPEKDLSDFL